MLDNKSINTQEYTTLEPVLGERRNVSEKNIVIAVLLEYYGGLIRCIVTESNSLNSPRGSIMGFTLRRWNSFNYHGLTYIPEIKPKKVTQLDIANRDLNKVTQLDIANRDLNKEDRIDYVILTLIRDALHTSGMKSIEIDLDDFVLTKSGVRVSQKCRKKGLRDFTHYHHEYLEEFGIILLG